MKHTLTTSHCVILVVFLCVCDRYEAHTYNFPLCPMAFGPVNPTFVWQVEAGICRFKVVFLCVFCQFFFFLFFFWKLLSWNWMDLFSAVVIWYAAFLYWVIQAGLLTPLTFAWHHLSPLAAFTSSVYFLHSGRRWQWICEFYTANAKGIFWGT